jgi:serine/threonine protein kinase
MEYIPFGDLENYMSNNGAMPEVDAQQVSFQILEGLSYMHREGFAHRDIKPGVSLSSSYLYKDAVLTTILQECAHQVPAAKE